MPQLHLIEGLGIAQEVSHSFVGGQVSNGTNVFQNVLFPVSYDTGVDPPPLMRLFWNCPMEVSADVSQYEVRIINQLNAAVVFSEQDRGAAAMRKNVAGWADVQLAAGLNTFQIQIRRLGPVAQVTITNPELSLQWLK